MVLLIIIPLNPMVNDQISLWKMAISLGIYPTFSGPNPYDMSAHSMASTGGFAESHFASREPWQHGGHGQRPRFPPPRVGAWYQSRKALVHDPAWYMIHTVFTRVAMVSSCHTGKKSIELTQPGHQTLAGKKTKDSERNMEKSPRSWTCWTRTRP